MYDPLLNGVTASAAVISPDVTKAAALQDHWVLIKFMRRETSSTFPPPN